jgi:hypothetical protein
MSLLQPDQHLDTHYMEPLRHHVDIYFDVDGIYLI